MSHLLYLRYCAQGFSNIRLLSPNMGRWGTVLIAVYLALYFKQQEIHFLASIASPGKVMHSLVNCFVRLETYNDLYGLLLAGLIVV